VDEARGGPAQTAGGGHQLDADGRSPYRTTCPYFRHEGPDGALLVPLERPDPANRCAALGWSVEPSLRQQATACLSPEHTSCPRYIHAETAPETVVRVPPPRPQPRSRAPRALRTRSGTLRPRSPATLGALLLLLASMSLSFAFVLLRGGLTLPGRSAPPANEVAGATGTPVPTTVAAVSTPAAPTSRPVVSRAPTAAPTPALTPAPTPGPTPRPKSERYAYLEPCPSRPNCWIYTIRRGDALSALANYFGHPLATIYRLNPWTKVRGIHPGDKLILPPPTR
jgi:hypothetical protein